MASLTAFYIFSPFEPNTFSHYSTSNFIFYISFLLNNLLHSHRPPPPTPPHLLSLKKSKIKIELNKSAISANLYPRSPSKKSISATVIIYPPYNMHAIKDLYFLWNGRRPILVGDTDIRANQ